MSEFLILVLQATSLQLAGIFGIIFAFGIPLSIIQKQIERVYYQSIGWKGILWTAWIGTPIHEFSHFVFAKIFRHRVSRVSIFTPNEKTGELGHVTHSYNPKSAYQTIGNFFIGLAPLLGGSIFLLFLLYILTPGGTLIFAPLSLYAEGGIGLIDSLRLTFAQLFSSENIHSWNFWVFLYISFAVASHIAPSSQDRKGMWTGFFAIVALLVLANCLAILVGVNITEYFLTIKKYLSILTAIFIYSLIISMLHYVFAFAALLPFQRR